MKTTNWTLDTFIEEAEPALRKGHLGGRYRLADLDEVYGAVNARKLSDLPTDSLKYTHIAAKRLLSDAFDRQGDYSMAAACLGEADAVWADLIGAVPPIPGSKEARYVEERLFLVLMQSVAEHRDGKVAQALATAEALQKRATELVPKHYYLHARIAYAIGRHLQSIGQTTRAEEKFASALEFVDEVGLEESGTLTAMIVVALARAALDQGQLSRGWRQLLVAKQLLSGSEDKVEIAFVEFLMGCVLRQQKVRLSDSLRLLKQSLEVFESKQHERFFLRCRYELAKAHFNQGRLTEASDVLSRELPQVERRVYWGDTRTRTRWEGNQLLLRARIAHERRLSESARNDAERALLTLGATSDDLRAQAFAVLADIALSAQHLDEAYQFCSKGLALKPIDKTDLGWLFLTACEINLQRGQIDLAHRFMQEWKQIEQQVENVYILDRAKEVAFKFERMGRGFYISFEEAENLNYEIRSRELRNFLVRRVRLLHEGAKLEQQAAILGVRRQTLANWLAEMRKDGLL